MEMGNKKTKLSVVVPCYNEEKTLKFSVENLLKIENENLELEVIIVNDASRDRSQEISLELSKNHPQIISLTHEVNQGKGAALRTGFEKATGDYVTIHDADLEYDPQELKELIRPLENNLADVVFGSRFLSGKARRVLYFWHCLGNKFLTLVSNMFTDLNLTDMETCYKVFRREIIKNIKIEENRFGFEPEIVAKVSQTKSRVYEIGISYNGRTYEEGKKIGWRDGFRALYCIFKYGAPHAPLPVQFVIYFFIGGTAAIVNILAFFLFLKLPLLGDSGAAIFAYIISAATNYFLCILILFKHKARFNSRDEALLFSGLVIFGLIFDVSFLKFLVIMGIYPLLAKAISACALLVFNFWARRSFIFKIKK